MSGNIISDFKTALDIAIDLLSNEQHGAIPGLKRRYYYRGSFVLLEHLTPRGIAVVTERLRRRGESEHAECLRIRWALSQGKKSYE
jgi:hypothetical protein